MPTGAKDWLKRVHNPLDTKMGSSEKDGIL